MASQRRLEASRMTEYATAGRVVDRRDIACIQSLPLRAIEKAPEPLYGMRDEETKNFAPVFAAIRTPPVRITGGHLYEFVALRASSVSAST